MLARPLDTLFHSADNIRHASAELLAQAAPEGRLHRSLLGLVAALDRFETDLAGGWREPSVQKGRDDVAA